MTKNAPSPDLILSEVDVDRRMQLLAELRDALRAAGVECVLTRRHRLVLRYSDGPLEPSGLTDPQLHMFTSGRSDVATTDGALYRLSGGGEFAVADPSAAAKAMCSLQRSVSPV